MAFFDDALRKSVPDGNITTPLMVAAGALLLGKMFGGFGGGSTAGAPASTTATLPQGQSPAETGGGGLLSGLGGLLGRLQQAGHGEVANSWVGTGENAPIQPGQLGSALGQQNVSDLARQAGVSEQELLAQLSKVLPNLVNNLTPEGRLPTAHEVSAWNRP
ncbi:MAG: DUF937 domain-containing protein [Acetobacteraceae bacterium]|nr:DUF937 domain-containing protein [Acetobacteraceae bacterium]